MKQAALLMEQLASSMNQTDAIMAQTAAIMAGYVPSTKPPLPVMELAKHFMAHPVSPW